MNSTLYEGDIIFVNKISYGALLPRAPIDIPLVPGLLFIKPIRKWLIEKNWRYHRESGLSNLKRGDVVVFRFHRNEKTFIKRCVALPGDTLQIDNDIVFINHKLQPLPISARLYYRLQTKTGCYTEKALRKIILRRDCVEKIDSNSCVVRLTASCACFLKRSKEIKSLQHENDTISTRFTAIFPHIEALRWTCSYYGSIVVPKRGVTVKLDTTNLAYYKKIISEDEENELHVKGKTIFINGRISDTYTFKMNYFFMLGDNRLNSLDSRFNGFVPEDKIVGKASLILFSMEKDSWVSKGFRCERFLKKIN
jgi:signal peptidase I